MQCKGQIVFEMLRRGGAVVEAIHWVGLAAVGATWEPVGDVLHRNKGLYLDARPGGTGRAGEVRAPRFDPLLAQ
jgi:hypothetical protein